MINIRPKQDYLVQLESVAMTDIVLNMFIFFFISFSLLYTFHPTRISKLEIKLPKAQSAVQLQGVEKITLSISKSGAYFVDDERIATPNMKRVLDARLKDSPSASLFLKIDNLARFDSVARALDVINELDIKKVSIAAIKKE